MRTTNLFIFVFFLWSIMACGQATGFAVIESKLVWENVFVSGEQNINSFISKHGRFKIVSTNGNVYKGVATNILYSCGHGVSDLKKGYNFDFEIELTDGKYRVTVYNITINPSKKGGNKITAEKMLLQNGKLKTLPENSVATQCLEEYFNKAFSSLSALKNRL